MSEVTLLLMAMYLLPCAIAHQGKKRAAWGITIINLFLGWTFVVWVLCLAWSVIPDRKEAIA